MTIKDIIIVACDLLNKDKTKSYLINQKPVSDEITCELDNMVALLNLVINELAHTYVPMITTETINSNGKIYYSKLGKKVIRVLNLLDSNGNQLEFKLFNEFLVTRQGQLTIEYEYVPDVYSLNDVVDYTERQVPLRVIAYGLVAEVLLKEYSFDQAVTWHKRYVSALEEKIIPKNATIKERSWL